MIVTEEEAKKKRCQESFGPPLSDSLTAHGSAPVQFSEAGVYATVAVTASPIHCIGSACMAWRWHRENIYRQGAANEFDVEVRVSDSAGYCGKAGRP